jgi:hypothetical protein
MRLTKALALLGAAYGDAVTITSALHRAARASADVGTVERGPEATGKRVVRQGVYGAEGRQTRKVCRRFGL